MIPSITQIPPVVIEFALRVGEEVGLAKMTVLYFSHERLQLLLELKETRMER